MSQSLKVVTAFAAIYLIWGSTYFAILFAIKDIPPLLMSGMRFLLAGSIIYLFCLVKGHKHPDFSSLLKNAVRGLLLLSGGTVSVAWAEQYIPSSTAAIIVAAIPFWFVLLDKRQWRVYFSDKLLILGLVVGFVGVALLFTENGKSSSSPPEGQVVGVLVIIAGGIAWATGSLLSKYRPVPNSFGMNAAVQLLVAGLVCFSISIVTGEARGFSLGIVHASAWAAFFYLVIFGSIIAYLCYLWLLKVRPAAQVSSYVYVNPVVAVLIGTIAGREPIQPTTLLSLSVILCGVFLVNLPKYRTRDRGRLCVEGN